MPGKCLPKKAQPFPAKGAARCSARNMRTFAGREVFFATRMSPQKTL